jgi:two-component system, NtrC family, nitrogen regulation response regulator NtrX
MADILVVDDEKDIRELVAGLLEDEGYETRTAGDSTSALASVASRRPSLVVLDIWLQGSELDGLEVLDRIVADHPDLPVVMFSGHGNIETAVSSIRRGAFDFIEKPFKADQLIMIISRAIEQARLKRENRELRRRAGPETELVGSSTAVSQLRTAIEKVAPTNARVLISGPAGSGKEVVARMLHGLSRRAQGPFVVLNAASMAPDRMEIELFGVEAGNSGADAGPRIGTFEQAHGGTLFLDEVTDMPPETQAKILRVLQEQTFERVGGDTTIRVDVRVISATSGDLSLKIKESLFREDLYHRLAVVPVQVPGLRERVEDIPELVRHFMQRASDMTGQAVRRVSDDALVDLQTHDWPGNVRELRNLVERLLIMAPGDANTAIGIDMLPPELGNKQSGVPASGGHDIEFINLPLREAREAFERDYLQAQISRYGGNISRTASFVGMERSALHRKLKSLGLGGSERA